MHHIQKLAFIVSMAALASAQSLSSLPSCATQGALSAIGASGCSTTDTACICKSKYFSSGLEQVAKQNCSITDYATAVALGRELCAQVGVDILPTMVIPTSTPITASMTVSPITVIASAPSAVTVSTIAPAVTTTCTAKAVVPSISVSTVKECDCEDDTPMATSSPSSPVSTWTGGAGRVGVHGVVAGVVGGLVLLGMF